MKLLYHFWFSNESLKNTFRQCKFTVGFNGLKEP